MALETKYRVCRIVPKNEFGVYRYELVSAQLPVFDFKDEAETWIEVSGEKHLTYTILEEYQSK